MKQFFKLLSMTSSISQQVGQLIITGFAQTTLTDDDQIVKEVKDGLLGGVLFYGRNIESEAQVRDLTSFLQSQALEKAPLFCCIDQEGGQVAPLNPEKGFVATASHLEISQIDEQAKVIATLVKENGFNVNFAPCVDVAVNPDNFIVKKGRCFSDDPVKVSELSKRYIAQHQKVGVLTSAKHFPGHGSSTGDTHNEFVDVSKSRLASELDPYRRTTADMVMLAHVFDSRIDSKLPASLSDKVVKLLKDKVGYDGVVITDDLQMEGIATTHTAEQAAVTALNAGVDLLLFANHKGDQELASRVRAAIIKEVPQQRITEAFDKVMALKAKLNAAAALV